MRKWKCQATSLWKIGQLSPFVPIRVETWRWNHSLYTIPKTNERSSRIKSWRRRCRWCGRKTLRVESRGNSSLNGSTLSLDLLENDLSLKGLLVLDNAPAHLPKFEDDILDVFNFIKVLYLSRNTNSVLHFVDEQVISNLKNKDCTSNTCFIGGFGSPKIQIQLFVSIGRSTLTLTTWKLSMWLGRV